MLPKGFECSENELSLDAEQLDKAFFETVEQEKMISDEIKNQYSITNLPVRLSDMHVRAGKLTKDCEVYSGYANLEKLNTFIANDLKPIPDGDGNMRFYLNRNGCVRYRKTRAKARNILSVISNVGTTEKNRTRLRNMGIEFDYPKPVELLRYLISLGCAEEGIVLDFFAGSGTTGHALLEQSIEDGINRRFILVQLPESTNETNLASLSSTRIRSSIAELKSKITESSQPLLDGGDSEEHLSRLGFRYFSLDASGFLDWRNVDAEVSVAHIEKQLELHSDHIDPERSSEAILFEILLKAGFDLCQSIVEKSVSNATVFSIEHDSLLICLEDEITQELLDEVVKLEPIQFICLDKAFQGNDQLKANAVQTFSAHNHGRDKTDQIIFRTV